MCVVLHLQKHMALAMLEAQNRTHVVNKCGHLSWDPEKQLAAVIGTRNDLHIYIHNLRYHYGFSALCGSFLEICTPRLES